MSLQDRRAERRNQLLAQLEQAEKEWGQRLEDNLQAQATFFKKIVDQRIGAGSATGRIRDRLASLTVDKISDFLTG